MAQADARSARALQWLDATTVEYDARDRIGVWLARAQVLAAAGRKAEARGLATQAVAAGERMDAPESPRLARAKAILASLGS
jgi:hypothetical protein